MNTTYTEAMALVDALKESLTEEVVGETGVISPRRHCIYLM